MVLDYGINVVHLMYTSLINNLSCYIKNIQIARHIPKGKLHTSIPTLDNGITSGKERLIQNDWDMCIWVWHKLSINHNKINQKLKLIHLYKYIFYDPPWDSHTMICQLESDGRRL